MRRSLCSPLEEGSWAIHFSLDLLVLDELSERTHLGMHDRTSAGKQIGPIGAPWLRSVRSCQAPRTAVLGSSR
jgi:hypothetical protein